MILDGKCPTGPIETAWDRHRFDIKLVNPANKRKHDVIVVGSEREKQRLLDVFRNRKIMKLPDGRKVEDIVLVR